VLGCVLFSLSLSLSLLSTVNDSRPTIELEAAHTNDVVSKVSAVESRLEDAKVPKLFVLGERLNLPGVDLPLRVQGGIVLVDEDIFPLVVRDSIGRIDVVLRVVSGFQDYGNVVIRTLKAPRPEMVAVRDSVPPGSGPGSNRVRTRAQGNGLQVDRDP